MIRSSFRSLQSKKNTLFLLLQFCSDLHLEFRENREWLKKHPLIPRGEILILAGDTYYLNKNFAKLDFIKKVSDDFRQVYLIPGNHEYYGGFDVSTAMAPVEMPIMDNVVLLNNKSVEIDDLRLIFSTFWSKIRYNFREIQLGMTDFRLINYRQRPFTIQHFNQLHEQAFAFLSREVQKEGTKVVVTHHLPSYRCNDPEFQGSSLNEAFCVEKTRFIAESEIDYWIYGHSHRNKVDFEIDGTRMLTNQLGYVGYDEHRSFDREKVIEVKG